MRVEPVTDRDIVAPETMPTANLVIALQKLARQVSYFSPAYRAALLAEAARRLNEYRQAERSQGS